MIRFANALISAVLAAVAVLFLCIPLFALIGWIIGAGE